MLAGHLDFLLFFAPTRFFDDSSIDRRTIFIFKFYIENVITDRRKDRTQKQFRSEALHRCSRLLKQSQQNFWVAELFQFAPFAQGEAVSASLYPHSICAASGNLKFGVL